MNDCTNCRHFGTTGSTWSAPGIAPEFPRGTCGRGGGPENARTTDPLPTRVSARSGAVSGGMTCDGFEEAQRVRTA